MLRNIIYLKILFDLYLNVDKYKYVDRFVVFLLVV